MNQIHSEIKKFINTEKANVSTKFLEDYINFFNYIRNWKVKTGHYPVSRKDVEKIFCEILTGKVNWKIKSIQKYRLTLPKASGNYMKQLKDETENVRKATRIEDFKFNEEDGVNSFNKREYLLNLPEYRLYELAREYRIPKYRKLAKWPLATLLLKQKDINSTIYKLIIQNR